MSEDNPNAIGQLYWRAVYHDGAGKLTGECLNQYNNDGSENLYKDIDRFRLARFDLLRRDNDLPVFSLYLRKDRRLIFRRRNFIKSTGERFTVYLCGWQMTMATVGGLKNITSICYIYGDGSVALDDARSDIELLDEER
jgi:hypothetical protein